MISMKELFKDIYIGKEENKALYPVGFEPKALWLQFMFSTAVLQHQLHQSKT